MEGMIALKIVAIIPARYNSTRMPGKPLVDICGKPMIWWIYKQAKLVDEIESIYVATDDQRIKQCCSEYGMNVIMTAEYPDHIARVHAASNVIDADYYLCINGDEPLVDIDSIKSVIELAPQKVSTDFFFSGAVRKLNNPAEVIDPSNLKVVLNKNNRCIYISRAPIPFPKATADFSYYKYIGIECFNKYALEFFINTPMGVIEKIEDIDHLRFIENDMPLLFKEVYSDSISVDTPKDLDFVRRIIVKGMV